MSTLVFSKKIISSMNLLKINWFSKSFLTVQLNSSAKNILFIFEECWEGQHGLREIYMAPLFDDDENRHVISC